MKHKRIENELRKKIDVNMPIIAIQDHDFVRIDELIKNVIGKNADILEWNAGLGSVTFDYKIPIKGGSNSLEEFLIQQCNSSAFGFDGEEHPQKDTYLLLKDVSEEEFRQPQIAAILHQMAQRRLYDRYYNTTIIIIGASISLPQHLNDYVSFLEIGVVDNEEDIKSLIDEHTSTNNYRNLTEYEYKELLPSLKGMTKFQIDRMLDMAMSSNGTLSVEDRKDILEQKKQMVRKSGLLDLIDTPLDIDSIGGMDALKKYLQTKQKVFANPVLASDCHLAVPKGVFIVGMPGCGKSLCAKATAALFKAPLLKMDMGSMMGKYVGQSEENLRKAIRIAEAAAPCVLWIDEIEKAFSGVGGANSEILTRMFGYFLSWMQEKTSSVYVIATANNADDLPPELKRKGRFDEIFCVNLPSDEERLAIFNVHLGKKGQPKLSSMGTALQTATKGFNGADIESVVNETLEKAFIQQIDANSALTDGKKIEISINERMLVETAKETVSISASCDKQIKNMKKVFEESCFKDATTGKMTKKQ